MHTRAVAVLLAALVGSAHLAPPAGAQQAPAPECSQWQECRQLALEARERGAYETFHDLAWRAVQTGPPDDSDLMYLLARAQSLSGRRRDALIMLRRLAERGVATNAAADEDFRRTRELAGWKEVESAFERLGTPVPASERLADAPPVAPAAPAPDAAPSAPSRAGAPSAPPVAAVSAAPAAPAAALRPVAEVARFAAQPFVPGGLAYDAVSRRFLFGDMRGRRLIVLGEGSARTNDLVRGDAAGFHDVTALAIDPARGDLWVASTTPAADAGTLHKLQLISGRVLAAFDASAGALPIRLSDLVVSSNGTVLILDSAGSRVLRLLPGAAAVDLAIPLAVPGPVSIAAGESDRVAYVAHEAGIVRLDLQARSAVPVAPPNGIHVGGFERIRWHQNSLVGIQTLPDGTRGVVRLHLHRTGQSVTAAQVVDDSPGAGAAPAFASVSGDDFYYALVAEDDSAASQAGPMNVVVRRVRLR